jgi:hypothetical protein
MFADRVNSEVGVRILREIAVVASFATEPVCFLSGAVLRRGSVWWDVFSWAGSLLTEQSLGLFPGNRLDCEVGLDSDRFAEPSPRRS